MTEPSTPRFSLGNLTIPNGTVLLMGIEYEGMGQTDLDTTRGRQTPKVFTYAFLKAGNLWYATGGPRAPQAAGWGAVERWLAKDNRVVRWVRIVTETAALYPSPAAPEPARIVDVLAAQVDTSQPVE